jgi:hypothetical protein
MARKQQAKPRLKRLSWHAGPARREANPEIQSVERKALGTAEGEAGLSDKDHLGHGDTLQMALSILLQIHFAGRIAFSTKRLACGAAH